MVRLDLPTGPCRGGVLFIPGVSGAATSSRFDPFARAVTDAGFACLRDDLWSSPADLDHRTIRELQEWITHNLDRIARYGPTIIVAKSFGAVPVLALVDSRVSAIILWAPAVGVAERGSLVQSLDTPLREFPNATDLTVDSGVLGRIACPVLVLVGTEDPVVSVDMAQRLADSLQQGTLHVIDGADHSFHGREDTLLALTTQFLDAQGNP